MASAILAALVVLFGGLLYYIYDGYLRCLRVINHFAAQSGDIAARVDSELPSIAVVIGVHNEAHQIVDRVENIRSQDYPSELLEVVVASDGSTDELVAVIAERFGEAVRLVHDDRRGGKSFVQNAAVASIQSSIVLFTDADTRFAAGFLKALVAPFSAESIGAVQAHLLFVPADSTSGMTGQARHWRAELEMRQLEADIGILVVASGACIAVRRTLWRPLDPKIGEDCMIPLDVVLQSAKVAYAEKAIAYEPADDEFENVIRSRARMTLRNWQGTWSRATLLNPLTHPRYAFALWSHKVLRWLSPIWLLGLSVAAFALPFVSSHRLLHLPAAAMLTFFVLAGIGGIAATRSRRLPVCSALYSFILANIGFLGGLTRAAFGQTITRYR